MMNLSTWLRSLPSRMEHVTRITIGNEAGDLDSAVSAITLAYGLSQKSPQIVTLPVLNYPKELFQVKTEVVYALGKADIMEDDLFFLPVLFDSLKSKDNLEVVLVDHNEPTGLLSNLKDNITLVIDHHPENPHHMVQVEKKIELVGSCSSLVAEYLDSNIDQFYLPYDARQLIAQTITIDTSGFSSIQLVAEVDRDQYAKMVHGNDNWLMKRELELLTAARFKIEGLSTRQLLLKDAKHLIGANSKSIFAATLHCDLKDFLSKETIWEELEEFYLSEDCKGAEILLMMGTVADGTNRGFGWLASKMTSDFSDVFIKWQDTVP